MSTVIFLSLHDLGVYFIFGAFVAGMGLLLAEVAWRWEQRRQGRTSTPAGVELWSDPQWARRIHEGLEEVAEERRRR